MYGLGVLVGEPLITFHSGGPRRADVLRSQRATGQKGQNSRGDPFFSKGKGGDVRSRFFVAAEALAGMTEE